MARRHKDWEEGLSKDLKKSIKNRREFFLALLDEGYTWREALNKIVKLIGVNEYVELIGNMKSSNLLNQLKKDSNITINTLDKITAPLGIELTFKNKNERAS
jgi:DNA-binding phage protein